MGTHWLAFAPHQSLSRPKAMGVWRHTYCANLTGGRHTYCVNLTGGRHTCCANLTGGPSFPNARRAYSTGLSRGSLPQPPVDRHTNRSRVVSSLRRRFPSLTKKRKKRTHPCLKQRLHAIQRTSVYRKHGYRCTLVGKKTLSTTMTALR